MGYRYVLLWILVLLLQGSVAMGMKVLVAGLTHGHVAGFLYAMKTQPGVELVGVVEKDAGVSGKYFREYGLPASLHYTSLNAAIRATSPDVVAAFADTRQQIATVRTSVQHSVPVMLEKPMGHSFAAAQEIHNLSQKTKVPVVINYETSWYKNTATFFRADIFKDIGILQQIEYATGHEGPLEIGVPPEFLYWLTRPELGGGALFDFGCYGIQLTLARLQKEPKSVSARLVKQKSQDIYKEVEDEAFIELDYEDFKVKIRASWSLEHAEKSWKIFGSRARVFSVKTDGIAVDRGQGFKYFESPPIPARDASAVALLKYVAGEGPTPSPYVKLLASTSLNLKVTKILEALRLSYRTQRKVFL